MTKRFALRKVCTDSQNKRRTLFYLGLNIFFLCSNFILASNIFYFWIAVEVLVGAAHSRFVRFVHGVRNTGPSHCSSLCAALGLSASCLSLAFPFGVSNLLAHWGLGRTWGVAK